MKARWFKSLGGLWIPSHPLWLGMAGNRVQVGAGDGRVRIKNNGRVVAGSSDGCFCVPTCNSSPSSWQFVQQVFIRNGGPGRTGGGQFIDTETISFQPLSCARYYLKNMTGCYEYGSGCSSLFSDANSLYVDNAIYVNGVAVISLGGCQSGSATEITSSLVDGDNVFQTWDDGDGSPWGWCDIGLYICQGGDIGQSCPTGLAGGLVTGSTVCACNGSISLVGYNASASCCGNLFGGALSLYIAYDGTNFGAFASCGGCLWGGNKTMCPVSGFPPLTQLAYVTGVTISGRAFRGSFTLACIGGGDTPIAVSLE